MQLTKFEKVGRIGPQAARRLVRRENGIMKPHSETGTLTKSVLLNILFYLDLLI
jgi:hypothetical protein